MEMGWTPVEIRDEQDEPLPARTDVEYVAIETVHVGDFVLLEPSARPASARCVIGKRAKTNERTSRIVGWLLELTGGELAWWPHDGRIWRRRIESSL